MINCAVSNLGLLLWDSLVTHSCDIFAYNLDFVIIELSNLKILRSLVVEISLEEKIGFQVFTWQNHCFFSRSEQLQNTPQLIYMSLNKNSVYCVMPRSSKPPDTCKWGGNELRGILKFSLAFLAFCRLHSNMIISNFFFSVQAQIRCGRIFRKTLSVIMHTVLG